MYKLDKNTLNKIYYKADNLVAAQNVRFTVWDNEGRQYVDQVPASNEIINPTTLNSHGLYYFNFTTPGIDVYLFCIGEISNHTHRKPTIISCGLPPLQMAFYTDSNLTAGINYPFEIYDLTGTILKTGTLTDFGHGFYGTDIWGLAMPGTYFLKVPPETQKFSLPLQYINSNVIMHGGGGASKARHSLFDYEGELSKRRIHARLMDTNLDQEVKGLMVNKTKDEDTKITVQVNLEKTTDEIEKTDKEWNKKWKDHYDRKEVKVYKPNKKTKNLEIQAKLVNTGNDDEFEDHNGTNPNLEKKDYIDKTNIVSKV